MSSIPRGLSWDTNKAAISLFWDTNMAVVTSCENTLYDVWLSFDSDFVLGLAPHMVNYITTSPVNTYTGEQIPLSQENKLHFLSCEIKKTNQHLITESQLPTIYHNNKIRKLFLRQCDD